MKAPTEDTTRHTANTHSDDASSERILLQKDSNLK